MRVADKVVSILIEKDIKKVFGIPGIGNQVLIDAMYGSSEIEFVYTRHEQAAAIMADCWGRLNDEVSICTASFVAGATNLLNGIAQAYQAQSPVLALVGESNQEEKINLPSFFKPITKRVITVQNPDDVLASIEEAFDVVISEPKGPVYFGLPVDIQTADVDDFDNRESGKCITQSENFPSSSRLNPLSVAELLSDRIPQDAIVTVDVGEHMVYVSKAFKEFNLLTSGSLYSMGFAFPAALSAKMSQPERKVYCIAGDGGFSMVMQELETAVRNNLKIVIIVFNNQCLGMIKRRQVKEFSGRFIGVEFEDIDFSLVAKSFGLDGIRVNSLEELELALDEAESQDESFLIDIVVDWKES